MLAGRARPLLIGHRGAAAHAPENSLASFRLARAAGADVLETDLWATADGCLVCHHDRDLRRTTDRRGAIPELTAAEVAAARVLRSEHGDFAAAFPDERVPTLDDLLAATPAGVGLALELKDPAFAAEARMRGLLAAVASRIAAGTVMLLSFHAELLGAARRLEPEVWVGLLGEHEPHPVFWGDGVGTVPQAMAANPGYMAEARAQRLFVCPIDPAPEPRLPWYLDLDVDAVLSDDPARTLEALRRLGRR